MGILFFVGRKVGKAKKAGKDNKGTTLYALYALYALYTFTNPTRKLSLSKEWQTHMTSLFLGTQKAKFAA